MDQTIKTTLKENRLHGNEQFPFAAYWIDQQNEGAAILDCHWHAEVEFFYVMQGEVLFQLDTDYFPVKAGEAVFVDSGQIHAGHSLNNAPCMFGALVFDTQLLSSASFDAVQSTVIAPFLERTRTFPHHITESTSWGKALLRHIRIILSMYDQQELGYEIGIKAHLMLMLQSILPEGRHVNRNKRERNDHTKAERLKKAIQFIQDNYQHPIRLSHIAEQIPMSEGQFSRFFKSMARQTPIEYLNSYRIRRASELLMHKEQKVSSIALDVGFDHMSYFIKVFRKQMNCTPSEYRKKMQLSSIE